MHGAIVAATIAPTGHGDDLPVITPELKRQQLRHADKHHACLEGFHSFTYRPIRYHMHKYTMLSLSI